MGVGAGDITDKVYIVTGSSRGVGLAICRALHERSARFAMLARTTGEIEQHAREFGSRALALSCDVANRGDVDRAVAQAVDRFGGIDGIVNNAGMNTPAPVERLTEEAFLTMFRINVQGPLNLIQAALPHLRARGGGNILNIGSAAVRSPEEFPHMGGYSAVKAALERLTMELRVEVSADNIAVTLFSLGSTMTYLGAGWDPEASAEAFAEWRRRGGKAAAAMDASHPAEAIVRCLESPPGSCADFIQFRPFAEMEKAPAMAT